MRLDEFAGGAAGTGTGVGGRGAAGEEAKAEGQSSGWENWWIP